MFSYLLSLSVNASIFPILKLFFPNGFFYKYNADIYKKNIFWVKTYVELVQNIAKA